MQLSRLVAAAVVVAVFVMGGASFSHAINPFGDSGFELSETDIDKLEAAAKKLYLAESVEVGTVETWNNAETGNSGTVTLTRKHAYKDLPCRRLQHDIRVKDIADSFRFVLDRCKTSDGSWKLL